MSPTAVLFRCYTTGWNDYFTDLSTVLQSVINQIFI